MAEWIAWGLLSAVLITAAVTDWRTHKVFDWLTYPAMMTGLAYWTGAGFLQSGWAGAGSALENSALAMVAGIVLIAIMVALGGLHGGDVKLFGAIGALSARWQCVLGTAFYGFILAMLMALVIMIRLGLVRRTFQRIFGAALTLVGGAKPSLPDDSPRVPLAVPFAVGGILAASEFMLHFRLLAGTG